MSKVLVDKAAKESDSGKLSPRTQKTQMFNLAPCIYIPGCRETAPKATHNLRIPSSLIQLCCPTAPEHNGPDCYSLRSRISPVSVGCRHVLLLHFCPFGDFMDVICYSCLLTQQGDGIIVAMWNNPISEPPTTCSCYCMEENTWIIVLLKFFDYFKGNILKKTNKSNEFIAMTISEFSSSCSF